MIRPLPAKEAALKLSALLDNRSEAFFKLGSTDIILSKIQGEVGIQGVFESGAKQDIRINAAGEITYGDALKLNPYLVAAQLNRANEVSSRMELPRSMNDLMSIGFSILTNAAREEDVSERIKSAFPKLYSTLEKGIETGAIQEWVAAQLRFHPLSIEVAVEMMQEPTWAKSLRNMSKEDEDVTPGDERVLKEIDRRILLKAKHFSSLSEREQSPYLECAPDIDPRLLVIGAEIVPSKYVDLRSWLNESGVNQSLREELERGGLVIESSSLMPKKLKI